MQFFFKVEKGKTMEEIYLTIPNVLCLMQILENRFVLGMSCPSWQYTAVLEGSGLDRSAERP